MRAPAGWRGDLLALCGGLALPFAFSPFEHWPLAVLSPACLFAACIGAAPRRAAGRGWLYGAGAFGAGVWWIVESFQFSHIALPVAVVLTTAFVAFLALYCALSAWAGCVLSRGVPHGATLLAVFPAAFVLGEWLRGWLLTGFTWLQLGYSQVDGPLRALLPIGGSYAAGLALAVAAGAAALLVLERRWRSAVAAAAVAIACAVVGLAGQREWTQPDRAPLGVAVVQGNVPQDQKWRPEMRGPTLERYVGLTVPHLGADLVVWPETALPGRRKAMLPFIDSLGAQARARGSTVLFGVPEWDGEPLRAYNSVYLTGAGEGRYRKRHLVPFGEFLPFDTLLRPVTRALGIPVASFHPGAAWQPPLRVAGHVVAVFVCYEIAFGNEVARALPEAALLVTVSNDAWFGDSIGPHQHLQMARARALETGRELVRATNTGISAFVDAGGRVRERLPQFQAGAMAAQVQPRTGTTPYVAVGDAPVIAAACVVLAAAGWLQWRRARKAPAAVRS